MTTLTAGAARVELAPEAGGRVASVQVDGVELLVTDRAGGPLRWGIYPMVPFAGRIRHGRFEFQGRVHELPAWFEGHAIHGTVLDEAWDDLGGGRMQVALGPPWPFGGRAVHAARLEPNALHLRLQVTAGDRAMPVTCGWHPWWRRRTERGSDVRLGFAATSMYRRDEEGIATGRLRAPAPGPWDDCFTGILEPPTVAWPGFLRVTTEASCSHVVVYDLEDDAVCVEPQTGPPDAVNLGAATVLAPGQSLVARTTFRWGPFPASG